MDNFLGLAGVCVGVCCAMDSDVSLSAAEATALCFGSSCGYKFYQLDNI